MICTKVLDPSLILPLGFHKVTGCAYYDLFGTIIIGNALDSLSSLGLPINHQEIMFYLWEVFE